MVDIRHIETLEALCQLVELQNNIIRAQAAKLCELDSVIMADKIAAADEQYKELVGQSSAQ